MFVLSHNPKVRFSEIYLQSDIAVMNRKDLYRQRAFTQSADNQSVAGAFLG